MNKNNSKPFIKWVGGKTQLLPEIQKKYPRELGNEINKYCEPFVGGGAVLFDILSKYNLEEVLINDINFELINTYYQIKNNINELIIHLKEFQSEYLLANDEVRKIIYYNNRKKFNFLIEEYPQKYNLEKAALFIFLNRTCFNGLYRVNKKGFFNVPIGRYKNPHIYNKENLLNNHIVLQNVNLLYGDYKNCNNFIDKNTFVYIDPPYRPLNTTSNFTSYSKSKFNDNNQIELSNFIDDIHTKGAKILLSNSDPKNTNKNDNFFDVLYENYNIKRVQANRMVSSKTSNRGKINEILINN